MLKFRFFYVISLSSFIFLLFTGHSMALSVNDIDGDGNTYVMMWGEGGVGNEFEADASSVVITGSLGGSCGGTQNLVANTLFSEHGGVVFQLDIPEKWWINGNLNVCISVDGYNNRIVEIMRGRVNNFSLR